MKLAIMQPYAFPYIGYFQLINAVDKFVFYDDVTFIKQGWINRNRILLNDQAFLFTIPLKEASSFKYIFQVKINDKAYNTWKAKFYKTMIQAYKKAPFFNTIFPLVESVLEKQYDNIADLSKQSIQDIMSHLKLEKKFVLSSSEYDNKEVSGQERILDICLKEKASIYINPIGGTELYSKEVFEQQGINLQFIRSRTSSYKQGNHEHIPCLSIIDVLMFNPAEEVRQMFSQYELE